MTDADYDWYGPDAAAFGDRVAGARDVTAMSQAQLARRMGIKKSTLLGWEQDLSEPRANKLSMLAGILNVSIKWLITGEGEEMSEPADEMVVVGDFSDILRELREIRTEMRNGADRTARLDKKLRLLLERGEQS